MRRRQLLAVAGSSLPVLVAGCTETNPDSEISSNESTDDTNGSERAADSESQDRTGEDTQAGDDKWSEPDWPTGPYADYDTTIVEVKSDSGTISGKVKAAVAHPGEQWQLGLSDADSMPENGGMLFESGAESELTFWMKDMSFGLDIVYVGVDRTITSIHHAPEPTDGDSGTEQQYRFSGTGQYVFEVNYNWTTRHNVTEGDRLDFELDG
ncbi:DUF192 domain-containing protein [Halovenus halobia]|uniref:DUF192 domain-containing protein n=1 Tax=Halovenus halobia TaxID=3396622 RepID=UPI003F579F96